MGARGCAEPALDQGSRRSAEPSHDREREAPAEHSGGALAEQLSVGSARASLSQAHAIGMGRELK